MSEAIDNFFLWLENSSWVLQQQQQQQQQLYLFLNPSYKLDKYMHMTHK